MFVLNEWFFTIEAEINWFYPYQNCSVEADWKCHQHGKNIFWNLGPSILEEEVTKHEMLITYIWRFCQVCPNPWWNKSCRFQLLGWHSARCICRFSFHLKEAAYADHLPKYYRAIYIKSDDVGVGFKNQDLKYYHDTAKIDFMRQVQYWSWPDNNLNKILFWKATALWVLCDWDDYRKACWIHQKTT